jgi:hypothetical protein
MTIHDMALTTAVGSASANQPAEWTDSAARAGALADELRRIEHSAPTTDDARTAATAAVAVDDVGSAMEVASAAPEGVPLDDHMAQMLLARLDEMSAALAPLREGDVG